jgi:hypothetical protein
VALLNFHKKNDWGGYSVKVDSVSHQGLSSSPIVPGNQIGKIAPVTVHDPDEEQRSDAVRSITGTDAPIHRDDHTFPPGDADDDVMYLKEGNLNHVETTPAG